MNLPTSCPDCGAGIVIGQAIAVCEANKYASYSGAGDCRWTLVLTPDLRRQADGAESKRLSATIKKVEAALASLKAHAATVGGKQ